MATKDMPRRHIDIDDFDVRVTCPECGHEHEWTWNYGNGLNLTYQEPCEGCGVELDLMFQIGATLSTSTGFSEEGWM